MGLKTMTDAEILLAAYRDMMRKWIEEYDRDTQAVELCEMSEEEAYQLSEARVEEYGPKCLELLNAIENTVKKERV